MFDKKFHETTEEEMPEIVVDLMSYLSSIYVGSFITCPFKSTPNKHCNHSMYAVYRGSIKEGVYYLLCAQCGFYVVGPRSFDFGDGFIK